MALPFPSPVEKYHMKTYDGIDPLRADLSQKGNNVFITGASQGIGEAIAFSFAKAGASTVGLLSRTRSKLEKVQSSLEAQYPNTKAFIFAVDVNDKKGVAEAFTSFAQSVGGEIHTLVANAGWHPGYGLAKDMAVEKYAEGLLSNVVGTLNTIQSFLPHVPAVPDATGFRANIIHTSSAVVQVNIPHNNAYSVAKIATAKLIEGLAIENPDIWIANFHPGVLAGAMDDISIAYGVNLEPKDDMSLPADWTVWAAGKGSAILPSGRYWWAHWDVDELAEVCARLKSHKEEDGNIILGALPMNQRFTLGIHRAS